MQFVLVQPSHMPTTVEASTHAHIKYSELMTVSGLPVEPEATTETWLQLGGDSESPLQLLLLLCAQCVWQLQRTAQLLLQDQLPRLAVAAPPNHHTWLNTAPAPPPLSSTLSTLLQRWH
jgi:hypothetical protein